MSQEQDTPKITQRLFVYEGQSVPVAPEVAADPEQLKRLLSTWVPAAKTGTLAFSEPDGQGVVTITLQARAQPKGIRVTAASPIQALLAATEGENPILPLYRDLNRLYAEAQEPVEIFVTQAEIEKTMAAGRKDFDRMQKIAGKLLKCHPAEAAEVLGPWS